MEFIDKVSLTSPEHLAMIFTSLESVGMLERDGQEVKKRGVLGRLTVPRQPASVYQSPSAFFPGLSVCRNRNPIVGSVTNVVNIFS